MPSRRSRRASSNDESQDEDEMMTQLIYKLQVLVPQLNQIHHPSSSMDLQQASDIVKETCSYIRKLEREVAQLSGKLSQFLDTIDSTNQDFDVDYIRTLLRRL